jgi:hypothetical protein
MVSHLPRGTYWLVLLHLPGLGRSDMIRAAEFRIPSVYPGDPQEAVWDYRLLPGRRREYLLLAVMPRPHSLLRKGAYLPLFHAVDLKLPGREAEVILHDKGITDTLHRSAGDRYTLFSREESTAPPGLGPELPRRGYRGAFGKGETHLLLPGFLFCLLLTSLFFTFTAHRELENRHALLTQLEGRTKASDSSLDEEIRLKRLSAGIRSVPASAACRHTPDPLMILGRLEDLLPPGTELIRLLCMDGRLQLELLGPAALKAAESLCGDSFFDEVRLGEIRPRNDASRRERYRISMRVAP